MNNESTPLTLGESRVRKSFNPSGFKRVHKVKEGAALLIDLLQAYKNDFVSTYYDSPAPPENAGEVLRLISLAQTAIEEGCIWPVKQ